MTGIDPPERGRAAAISVVGAFVVAWWLLHRWWLARDEGIQVTDAAFHLSQVAQWGQALGDGPAAFFAMRAEDERQRYGTLWYAVGGAVSRVTTAWPPHLLLGLTGLLGPLLAWGGWRLGAALSVPGRRVWTAMTCAIVLLALPGVVHYSRVLVLDVPLTALVTLAAAAWIEARNEGLSRRRLLVALAWTAAATLVKANALAFLLGPALVACRPAWKLGSRGRNLGIVGVVVVGIAALTLGLGDRGSALKETLLEATWPGKALGYAAEGTLSRLPADWADFVADHSWEITTFTVMQTITPPVVLIGAAGLGWVFLRRRGCEEPRAHWQRLLLFTWLVPPGLGLAFLLRALYDERYLLPFLPPIAAGVAMCLADLPRPWIRGVGLVLVTALLGVTDVITTTDLWPALRPRFCTTVPGWGASQRVARDLWLCALYPRYHFLDRPTFPTHERWPVAEIEDRLVLDRAAVGRPLRALFLDDLYGLFYRVHQRELLRATATPPLRTTFDEGSLTFLEGCDDEGRIAETFGGGGGFEDILDEVDVVVLRWGSREGEDLLHGRRCRAFMDRAGSFVVAAELALHDGSTVRVYARWER